MSDCKKIIKCPVCGEEINISGADIITVKSRMTDHLNSHIDLMKKEILSYALNNIEKMPEPIRGTYFHYEKEIMKVVQWISNMKL
jgi:hypothetical protein